MAPGVAGTPDGHRDQPVLIRRVQRSGTVDQIVWDNVPTAFGQVNGYAMTNVELVRRAGRIRCVGRNHDPDHDERASPGGRRTHGRRADGLTTHPAQHPGVRVDAEAGRGSRRGHGLPTRRESSRHNGVAHRTHMGPEEQPAPVTSAPIPQADVPCRRSAGSSPETQCGPTPAGECDSRCADATRRVRKKKRGEGMSSRADASERRSASPRTAGPAPDPSSAGR